MSGVLGTWALTMRTPIGSIPAELVFTADGETLQGTATGKSETVVLSMVTSTPGPDGERVTWSQSITRPLRLNLDFEVVLTGDEMHGFSRAGRLPRSTVTGRRVRPPVE